MLSVEERKVLRRFFDERDVLVRELLVTVDAHEKALGSAREALQSISETDEHTLGEIKKKATKALEKIGADLGGSKS